MISIYIQILLFICVNVIMIYYIISLFILMKQDLVFDIIIKIKPGAQGVPINTLGIMDAFHISAVVSSCCHNLLLASALSCYLLTLSHTHQHHLWRATDSTASAVNFHYHQK